MKLIFWNCRGLLKPDLVRQLRILISHFKPAFIGLLETHINMDKIFSCCRLFGRHWNININPAKGRASVLSVYGRVGLVK